MIGMFALSAVSLNQDWVKLKTMKLVFTATLSMQLQEVTSKTGWLEYRIMCLSENCFSELAL